MIPVTGKNVVVTGIVTGESRTTAEERLRQAGAYVSGSVTGTTDLLITGAKVGKSKTDAAEKRGVTVVPWEQIAWDGEGDGHVEPVVRKPVAAARVRQIGPMLADKGDGTLPTGSGWSYEVKWDGVRCIATVKDGAVAMQSRSGKTDWAESYAHITAELATLPDCILDGELVILSKLGGSFQDLAKGNGRGSFMVFDCIEVGTKDLRMEPLSERRIVVADVLTSKGKLTHIAQSPVFQDGEQLLRHCVANGMEGLVAKRDDSRYMDGARNRVWTKVKVRPEQEFVVVGFTPGEGRRKDTFGALLLGVYDNGDLTYCGKVGTGWDDQENMRLHKLLTALPEVGAAADAKTLGMTKAEAEAVTWVLPSTVVQCEFQRWTNDGVLWHPSYKGQRHDKLWSEVTRDAVPVV